MFSLCDYRFFLSLLPEELKEHQGSHLMYLDVHHWYAPLDDKGRPVRSRRLDITRPGLPATSSFDEVCISSAGKIQSGDHMVTTTKCNECERQIPTKSKHCPHCSVTAVVYRIRLGNDEEHFGVRFESRGRIQELADLVPLDKVRQMALPYLALNIEDAKEMLRTHDEWTTTITVPDHTREFIFGEP
jgi:hypothetical protein